MKRSMLLRIGTLVLAYAHTFPATKHLAAFVHSPSLSEGWKGAGAVAAIGLYLLPVRLQLRVLRALWQRRRVLGVTTWALAAAHAVPALDHFPKFLCAPTWADGWRGCGAVLAIAWFLTPVAAQARVLTAVGRLAQVRSEPRARRRPAPASAFLSSESAVHE
jgi:hypothetical protein